MGINGNEFINNNGKGIDYYYDNDDSNEEFSSSHNDIDVVKDDTVNINHDGNSHEKHEVYKEANGKKEANNLFDSQNDVLYAQDDTSNLDHDDNIDESDVTNKKSNG